MVNLNHGFKIDVKTSKFEAMSKQMLEPSGKHFDRCQGLGKALTLFLAEDDVILETSDKEAGVVVEGAQYEQDSHMLQKFGGAVILRAYDEAEEEVGNNTTAAYYETALRKIYEDPNLDLLHIKVGVSSDTSQTYKIFGFISDIRDPEGD